MPVNAGAQHMKKRDVVGKIRRAQLITSYGPGAIADLPDHSVIMASPQYWKTDGCDLHEKNLEDLLNVSCFYSPYCYRSGVGHIPNYQKYVIDRMSRLVTGVSVILAFALYTCFN